MAAGLHLTHKINWSDLKRLVTQPCGDPGIKLPIGPCELIHLTKRKVEIQVNNRQYLSDKVCKSPDCQVSGSKVFRKTSKEKVALQYLYVFPWYDSKTAHFYDKKVLHFIDCFTEAVHEFADTERKKVMRTVNSSPDRSVFIDEVINMIEHNHPKLNLTEFKSWYWCSSHRLCHLFPILIEAGDSKTLLEFSNDEIRSVFSCLHGGQAVGNNWAFLYYHVFNVYFTTNLIVAFNLESNPAGWGEMRPKNYFRRSLMHDCDGQTFLDSCRKYLEDDVYMKDFDAMKELCKMCFKFIYFTEMLAKEVGISWLEANAPWHGYSRPI